MSLCVHPVAGVSSPRPAGHREFSKYFQTRLRVASDWLLTEQARGEYGTCDPCLREDPGQEG